MFNKIIDKLLSLFSWSIMDVKKGDRLKLTFSDDFGTYSIVKTVGHVGDTYTDENGNRGIYVRFSNECVPVLIMKDNNEFEIERY